MYRIIWQAKCADGSDCVNSVRYGESSLKTEVEAEALRPTTTSSECYFCNVTGAHGNGSVAFSVSDRGEFYHCSLRLP